jgi:polyamine oxidase
VNRSVTSVTSQADYPSYLRPIYGNARTLSSSWIPAMHGVKRILALCITSCLWNLAASHVVKTKVAVLGGGMAGIIAARTLHEQGIQDFVVVEARTELGLLSHLGCKKTTIHHLLHRSVGGRMQDVALGNGVKVELGPNWVQGLGEGATQNPIYTLALKHKLVDVFSDPDNLTTFDNHGPVNMDPELDAFDDAWTSFLAAAGALTISFSQLTAMFIPSPQENG